MYFQSLNFQVRAIADDYKRTSEATVIIEVEDINDNSPEFSQEVRTNGSISISIGKTNPFTINCDKRVSLFCTKYL
jgi:hypothetical protein